MLASKALAAAVSQEPVYIDDVFSTYLYTGNGSTQTITNGIDLAGEGGMVWIKDRTAAQNGRIQDTVRGASANLIPAGTNASQSLGSVSSFNSSGFSLSSSDSNTNANGNNFVAWTFRKQAKFFDVVTWTGNGSSRTISHNLGSVPGCIIVKRTDTTADWQVYHRANTANPETDYLVLNSTAATADDATRWNDTLPTSAVFSLGTDATVNASGGTYVAYLFAHDAGGFGLSGTDNVISCGSYSGTGAAGNEQNLGYEPQWVLIKKSNGTDDWHLFDNMRGIATGGNDAILYPNLANAEFSGDRISLTATGFLFAGSNLNQSGGTYIYIAIRRGPMKVPTSGTSVFSPVAYTGSGAAQTIQVPSVSDVTFIYRRNNPFGDGDGYKHLFSRIISVNGDKALPIGDAGAESSSLTGYFKSDRQTGFDLSGTSGGYYLNVSTNGYISINLRRAPGFFDVVCWTGNGSALTQSHNLGVTPELMICKSRTGAELWGVYVDSLGNTKYLRLNATDAENTTAGVWNNTTPTATQFTTGTTFNTNAATYVAYLFATLAGVSKVGSYTGSGTTKQIDCGFTAGARFVLIKRTDSTGDWYWWDSARGIVAGNDPYLLINSTALEVTSTDYVDSYSAGFELSSTAPAAINANGGTYIFLAIA